MRSLGVPLATAAKKAQFAKPSLLSPACSATMQVLAREAGYNQHTALLRHLRLCSPQLYDRLP